MRPRTARTREQAGSEREAMYPMTGYALVRVESQEPPGEALAKVGRFGRLEDVELPDSAPMVGYVVYDAEGNAYRRADVEPERPEGARDPIVSRRDRATAVRAASSGKDGVRRTVLAGTTRGGGSTADATLRRSRTSIHRIWPPP